MDKGIPFVKFNPKYLPDWCIPRWIAARVAHKLPVPKGLVNQQRQQTLF